MALGIMHYATSTASIHRQASRIDSPRGIDCMQSKICHDSEAKARGCRWAATLGIVLAISRGFIAEQGVAFEPELALLEVVAHTHWLPRHWRGRGHTREVQEQFQQLFQFKVCPPTPALVP